jgi:hypothetical protein
MKTILTKKTEKILVSDIDYAELSNYTWHVDSNGYAGTNIKLNEDTSKRQRKVRMHQLILPEAELVDHINRNKLDNRRSNLRSANNSQNTVNRSAATTKKASLYKGVHKTASGSWQAMIWYKGKNYGLGSYKTPEEAALVYNMKAEVLYGDYAFINVIN